MKEGRPILKELKDRHIIAVRGGRYFVRPVTLATIRTELKGEEKGAAREKQRPRRVTKIGQSKTPSAAAGDAAKRSRRSPDRKAGNLSVRFAKWIEDGFFREPKTLADVQKRFHKEGLIVPRTSVPQYLLKAVRSGQLTREEAEINKKRVWIYRSEG